MQQELFKNSITEQSVYVEIPDEFLNKSLTAREQLGDEHWSRLTEQEKLDVEEVNNIPT